MPFIMTLWTCEGCPRFVISRVIDCNCACRLRIIDYWGDFYTNIISRFYATIVSFLSTCNHFIFL
ncbi:hypothetical protein PVAP13_3KG269627 [Panicum virgatum]|uniref:Uncharacterized protein n=1 Tax=Panicum virgatum TaxID=38727 RepID=A0A8T0V6W7_PANVG|nr:hypothetical protein PVAP13_3KG269627 [Panicum virgatum]